MIKISAVVCTYNRAPLLVDALESLLNQTLDPACYEVLVVDNGSTDNTGAVVRRLIASYGDHNLRIVREIRQGLAHARNAGLRNTHGCYVAYLDDDAKAQQDWLQKIVDCFETVDPPPIVVGGPILPFYDTSKPTWFRDDFETRNWGTGPRFLEKGEVFSGSNMTFQREVLERLGGFDTRLGMRGPYLSAGEETALFERIWQGRDSTPVLYYSPQLVVFHYVPEHKMTVSYQLRRSFAKGQARALRTKLDTARDKLLMAKEIGGKVKNAFIAAFSGKGEGNPTEAWLVDHVAPIVAQSGHLLGSCGLTIRVKQRTAAMSTDMTEREEKPG
jgi:glycosyltransferase involved in cell wall biosynthesis